MANAAEITTTILRSRIEEMKDKGNALYPELYTHIWTKEIEAGDTHHTLEFYLAYRKDSMHRVDLRMGFADIDHCPARTIASFQWNLMGATAIGNAVQAIIDSY